MAKKHIRKPDIQASSPEADHVTRSCNVREPAPGCRQYLAVDMVSDIVGRTLVWRGQWETGTEVAHPPSIKPATGVFTCAEFVDEMIS